LHHDLSSFPRVVIDDQRTMTPGKLLNVWIMTSASVTTPLTLTLTFAKPPLPVTGAAVAAVASKSA
jgi:hypothetical protein